MCTFYVCTLTRSRLYTKNDRFFDTLIFYEIYVSFFLFVPQKAEKKDSVEVPVKRLRLSKDSDSDSSAESEPEEDEEESVSFCTVFCRKK